MNINVLKTNKDKLFLNKEGMWTKQIKEDLIFSINYWNYFLIRQ